MFTRSALLSGRVSQNEIDQAIAAIREKGGLGALPAVEIGDDRLAEQMVKMGFLTNYQAEQLKMGHTKLTLGPYVIRDFLAQGGMGQVFVGIHEMMGRKVAIKVLPQSKSTPDAIRSFTREIQTQAQVDHKHLVRAYDAGHDGNVYFLVTEYVPGTDLRRLIRSQGALKLQQAAAVIIQASEGLQYAHSCGLIHRDVKPGNILVTPKGVVKVSDLGLAGFLQNADEDPRAGKIVGTADYLAPEKIMTPKEITAVSDIYSLGCTLYYAVTGKVPFPGGNTREKARRHCEETPWHPRQFNPDITDEFVDLIADMMEKDPAKRIQSAAEVARRLEPWAGKFNSIPNVPLKRSPWQSPSVPSDRDETVDDIDGLVRAEESEDSPTSGSASQISEGTFPLTSAQQETNIGGADRPVMPSPPPVPSANTQPNGPSLATVLAIAIPVSFAAGAVAAWAILELLRS